MVFIKQIFASHILFCAFFFLTTTSSHALCGAGEANVSSAEDTSGEKVKLSLYYESLCPFCANFIVNGLSKVLETDIATIVDVRLIPWGNTQIAANRSWICQHGPNECLVDIVEACSIRTWPNLGTHLKFIECVERHHLENNLADWQSCFPKLGLSPSPIRDCFGNGLGVGLELSYADETASLNPPHTFVPWVLVDNLPLREDYQNFVAYVCGAYKGSKKPNSCKSHPLDNTSSKAERPVQVCYPMGTQEGKITGARA